MKPVLTEGRRLSLSVFPLKRAPHAEWNNEIEKTAVFSSIFFTYVKVRLPVVQFLRRVGVV